VIVGGGVVMAASYEARDRGVRSGMGGSKARRLCPQAVVVGPDFDAYSRASRELFAVFRDTAPTVEGLSMEEAFLDVGGLERISGEPAWIAAQLRRRVRRELELPLSVGVARSKSIAKMASRAAKPDGLLVVAPERELEFLHPLPVGSLWGVGPATAAKLERLGAHSVGQLASVPLPTLVEAFGESAGRHLHALARGADRRRVTRGRGRRSFGAQTAMRPRRRTRREIERLIRMVIDRLTRRMRAKGRSGRTVTLRLRFADYRRLARSRSLSQPTADSATLATVAIGLLDDVLPEIERRGLTLVGAAVSNLAPRHAGTQLALEPASERLDGALDEIKGRFGSAAVGRGGP
jgi:DNA polymerase-4